MDRQQRRSTSATRGRISGKGESSRRTTKVPNDQNDPSVQQDKNKYPPIANVSRIMRDAISDRGRISDDAKETVQACVSEFIGHVTTMANQKCHSEYRKTITAEDIIFAMGALGFDNYVKPLSIYLEKMRETDPDRKSKSRLSNGKRHASSDPPKANLAKPSPQFEGYAMPSNNGCCMGNGAGGNEEGSLVNVPYDSSWQFM